MAKGNYICEFCSTALEADHHPTSGNCPARGGGHFWYGVGWVGNKSWQCGQCGVVIKSDGNPTSGKCNKGGGHNWNCLG